MLEALIIECWNDCNVSPSIVCKTVYMQADYYLKPCGEFMHDLAEVLDEFKRYKVKKK